MHPLLEGQLVILEEVQPKYFSDIIKWRNNTMNNKYLNQPFLLTMELQKKWYENVYLNDSSQGLYVMIDKDTSNPFGHIGWTDYDRFLKRCVAGRLLVGDCAYRGSKQWIEAAAVFNQYVYEQLFVDTMYAHIALNNIPSIRWHLKWGYEENSDFVFPNEKCVNGIVQKEFKRSYGDYKENLKFNMNNIYLKDVKK